MPRLKQLSARDVIGLWSYTEVLATWNDIGPWSNSQYVHEDACWIIRFRGGVLDPDGRSLLSSQENSLMERTIKPTALKRPATVLIVDDDLSILKAFARLIRSVGLEARTYNRPSLLLASKMPAANACLVVDINLPEMSGIELYRALIGAGHRLPIVLITGRNPSDTQSVIAGIPAIAVLYKPIDEEPLLEAIHRALAQSIVTTH